MKINYGLKLSLLDGTPIKTQVVDPKTQKMKGIDLTVQRVCIDALMEAPLDERVQNKGEEKFHRFMLASKVNDGEDLKADEIALIKYCIGETWPPHVLGPVFKSFDAADQGEEFNPVTREAKPQHSRPVAPQVPSKNPARRIKLKG